MQPVLRPEGESEAEACLFSLHRAWLLTPSAHAESQDPYIMNSIRISAL
jgi:hypothetical protein